MGFAIIAAESRTEAMAKASSWLSVGGGGAADVLEGAPLTSVLLTLCKVRRGGGGGGREEEGAVDEGGACSC